MSENTFSVDGQEIRDRLARVLNVGEFVIRITHEGSFVLFNHLGRDYALPFNSVLSDDGLIAAYKPAYRKHLERELANHERMAEGLRQILAQMSD